MTRDQIAARLRSLASEMDDIAVAMDYYGGLAEWAVYGRELVFAAGIVGRWADEIECDD